MNKFFSLISIFALLFLTTANAAVEIVLDGEPIPLDSMAYDFDDRVIDAASQDGFACAGPQTQTGDGLVLQIDGQVFRLATARFTRSDGTTRIVATTPGELPTCGPEGLIFQDYFQ